MKNLNDFKYYLNLGKKYYPNIPFINEIDLYKALSFTNMALSIKFEPPKELLAETYLLRGKINSSLLYYEDSILDFDKVIEIQKDSDLSYFHRANAKNNLNQVDAALDDFNKAIEINSFNENFYIQRSFIKEKLNLFEEAIDDIDEAINLNPNNLSFFARKGALEYILGNYGDAINNFDIAIKKTTNDIDAFMLESIYRKKAEIKYKDSFYKLLKRIS